MTYYTEEEARRLVIEAGHRLVQTGLVARTWGNISARISLREMIITPSGRDYETLCPEELVKVCMDDLSYQGSIRPSSELGVHADAYGLRRDVAFIIHTHQLYASAVGAAEEDLPFAPCAHYGLPGTAKLRQAMCDAIARNVDSRTFLMAKHGTLCLGESYQEAFAIAEELELKCKTAFALRTGIHEKEQILPTCCRHRHVLLPYIDDFSQLVGPCALIHGGRIHTPRSDDTSAMELIVRKNCAAALYARTPLSLPDALVQRMVYLLKYSKQKDRNRM